MTIGVLNSTRRDLRVNYSRAQFKLRPNVGSRVTSKFVISMLGRELSTPIVEGNINVTLVSY